jgi:hypothetical protein
MPGASKGEEECSILLERRCSGGFRGDNENRGFNKETISGTVYHELVWTRGKGFCALQGNVRLHSNVRNKCCNIVQRH